MRVDWYSNIDIFAIWVTWKVLLWFRVIPKDYCMTSVEHKYMKSLIHFWGGDKTIGKMSAKMTKTLSIMVFPNYQDESSVVRSRERCTGETSRHRRCLDECFVWRELLVLSFNPFSFLSAVFFLYLLKKGHYGCLVGLKPLRNPESKPQPKTLSSIWWIWGETYIKFYQTTYCHRIW